MDKQTQIKKRLITETTNRFRARRVCEQTIKQIWGSVIRIGLPDITRLDRVTDGFYPGYIHNIHKCLFTMEIYLKTNIT